MLNLLSTKEYTQALKELGIDTAAGLGYCQGDEEFYKASQLQTEA